MKNFEPLLPNKVYHIFTHAVSHTNLFFNQGNYEFLLKRWKEISQGSFNTFAYCLMNNHFHLCVHTLPQPVANHDQLIDMVRHQNSVTHHSKKINNFLSSYTLALNKQQNRRGALFRSRFGRIEVKTPQYFCDLICYIHHNPIHHFGYEDYKDWAYSSYKSFLTSSDDNCVKKDVVINRFGGVEWFGKYHSEYKLRKRYVPYEETVQEIFREMQV